MATGPPISGGDLDYLGHAFNNRSKEEDLDAAKSLLLLHGEVATGVTDDEKPATENGSKIHGSHGLPPKQKKEKSLQYNRWKKEEREAAIHDPQDLDLLPDQLRNLIESLNGTEIAFVMKKTLYCSDLNWEQKRLSFNVNKVQNEFLSTPAEVEKVEEGIGVTVIQPCLEITPNVELRKRSKNNGRYSEYVLTGRNWFEIAQNERNGLEENDMVRLWSFRMGPDLCFALVKA